MSGPHFRDYHLLLDEQATKVYDTTDVIAERIRKLGAPTLESARGQMFPTLTPEEVSAARRFAQPRRFADGEHVYERGKPAAGLFLVLSGSIRMTGRDAHGRDLPVVEHMQHQFAGELGLLSGAHAYVDGTAVGEV